MTARQQNAALVALLRARPDGMSWNEIAAEVAFSGDAAGLWTRLHEGDALVPDPRADAALEQAAEDVLGWESEGLRLITVLDTEFPQRLLDIRETPPFLFTAGEARRSDPGMSVVGSRDASERGRKIAAAAAGLLVERGLAVIAGLAAGIDTAAHEAALASGGRTVAFVGTGITKHYPAENANLQAEIARRGLVLSQFWPDAPPTKQSFPMRNATMSGYGLATIIVEAGEHSGTRIQARKAVEHGRPVILTDMVVDRTKWGSALVGQPGVYVARGVSHLEDLVDRVLADRDVFDRALEGLARSAVA